MGRLSRVKAARPGAGRMAYVRLDERDLSLRHTGDVMKKLLLLALAIIGALLVYRQVQSGRAEQDLWAEATDSVKR
jgi:hypothetical protein